MKKFAEITAKYIDQPFGTYSCMGFLYSIYTDLGVDVPDTYEDLTLGNYMDAYKRDPRRTQIRLLKLVRGLGRPSTATLPRLGDLLVVAQNTTRATVIPPGLFPAIYTGKGQAAASFRRSGVRAFVLDQHQRAIVARRMI